MVEARRVSLDGMVEIAGRIGFFNASQVEGLCRGGGWFLLRFILRSVVAYVNGGILFGEIMSVCIFLTILRIYYNIYISDSCNSVMHTVDTFI